MNKDLIQDILIGHIMIKTYDIADPIRVADINDTPFKVETLGYTFYFSRRYSMRSFISKLGENFNKVFDRITTYLPAKSDTEIEGVELLSIIHLYSLIEKNGVRIVNDKGDTITCLSQIKVDVHFFKE